MINNEIEQILKHASENLAEHSKAIREIDDSLAVLTKSVNELTKFQQETHEENRREWAEMKARFFQVDQRHEEFIANSKIVLDELVNTRLQFKENNGRLDRIEKNLDQLAKSQVKTDEQIKDILRVISGKNGVKR